jgi:monovalent cation:H+ antiporter-2, CPA2 family
MAGRTTFAVLLFQDLMVAPLLFMTTMLGIRGVSVGTALISFLVPALTGLSILVLGGRLVMRPLFRQVAAAGSTEFFMAACLFVVIGTGVESAAIGLSMGLGAFIAGILLAETEYRREIEVTIDPFRGLLLGLFFCFGRREPEPVKNIFGSPHGVRSRAEHHCYKVLCELARRLDRPPARASRD